MTRLFGVAPAILFACACLAPRAAAQAVNPQTVSFFPSPDHDVADPDGVPLVTWYGLQIHEYGDSQPFLLLNLGKPDPGADGRIEIAFSSIWLWPPRPGVLLEARVVAVGPGGYGESDPSNVFVFQPPDRVGPPGTGGPPSVVITAPPNGVKLALSPRIALRAAASAADGRIASVSFYVDGQIAGTAPRRPYIVWWTSAIVGTHSITAVAFDDHGVRGVSRSVSVTITRSSPRVAPPGSKKTGTAKPRPPAKPRAPG